jgi:hypothetical protein
MARRARALPQVESTILVEGIDKKVIKCKARKDFTLGFTSVKAGETFFLVRSERRENRYYAVRFSDERHCYQCSCGCGTREHAHLKAVREQVMTQVTAVNPQALPMAVPAPVQSRKTKPAITKPVEQSTDTVPRVDVALLGNLNVSQGFQMFR